MAYEDVPGFESVYLEDSFVLDVRVTPSAVVFELELVLLEAHPLYSEPADGEQYCYRRGRIEFSHVSALRWTRRGLQPAVDRNAEIDYGGFDQFEEVEGQWLAGGNWGDVVVDCSTRPTVTLQ